MKRTGFKRKNNAENIPKKVAQSYIHKAQEAIKCIAKTATFYTPINEQSHIWILWKTLWRIPVCTVKRDWVQCEQT